MKKFFTWKICIVLGVVMLVFGLLNYEYSMPLRHDQITYPLWAKIVISLGVGFVATGAVNFKKQI